MNKPPHRFDQRHAHRVLLQQLVILLDVAASGDLACIERCRLASVMWAMGLYPAGMPDDDDHAWLVDQGLAAPRSRAGPCLDDDCDDDGADATGG